VPVVLTPQSGRQLLPHSPFPHFLAQTTPSIFSRNPLYFLSVCSFFGTMAFPSFIRPFAFLPKGVLPYLNSFVYLTLPSTRTYGCFVPCILSHNTVSFVPHFFRIFTLRTPPSGPFSFLHVPVPPLAKQPTPAISYSNCFIPATPSPNVQIFHLPFFLYQILPHAFGDCPLDGQECLPTSFSPEAAAVLLFPLFPVPLVPLPPPSYFLPPPRTFPSELILDPIPASAPGNEGGAAWPDLSFCFSPPLSPRYSGNIADSLPSNFISQARYLRFVTPTADTLLVPFRPSSFHVRRASPVHPDSSYRPLHLVSDTPRSEFSPPHLLAPLPFSHNAPPPSHRCRSVKYFPLKFEERPLGKIRPTRCRCVTPVFFDSYFYWVPHLRPPIHLFFGKTLMFFCFRTLRFLNQYPSFLYPFVPTRLFPLTTPLQPSQKLVCRSPSP